MVVVSARSRWREGARPGAAPARPGAAARRSGRPRRAGGRPRRGRLRARRPGRGPRAVRASAAACSTSTRRPRTAPCASTSSATRSSRCAGSPRSPSARWATRERVEIAPAAELAAERPRAGRDRRPGGARRQRPDIAELLPVERFRAFLDLVRPTPRWWSRPRRRSGPALADHWQDVTAAFHDADAHHLYVPPDADRRRSSTRRARVRLSAIDAATSRSSSTPRPPTPPARSLREAEPELERLVRSGYRTVVTWPRRGEGERAAYNLARLRPAGTASRAERRGRPALRAGRRCATGSSPPALRLAVIPEHRLLRRRRGPAHARAGGAVAHCARSPTCAPATSSSTRTTAIARFAGFETKTVAGVTRDYLYLEYAGDDRVFVPSDQLAKISRYVGAGGEHPRSRSSAGRAGTSSRRGRAARLRSWPASCSTSTPSAGGAPATRSPSDSDWQRDFEARFPFRRRPDQRDAIEAVKADMEAPRPMDRLICGDVGYGKTEVALRAAFKAAEDGKQVLDARPHHDPGPAALRHLRRAPAATSRSPSSRCRASGPRAEQRAVVRRFSEGRVDILIGTHRLLSRDVRAKDLGPAGRRRGAALRGQAEGAHAPAAR